jgi:tetratricopeptide (TPR) repeat protein
VNIWARIGVFLTNIDYANKKPTLTYEEREARYDKGIKYLLSAYEINPTNNYILLLLTDFYVITGSYQTAKFYLDEIDSSYHLEGVDELRAEVDSLLNLR